MQDLRRELFHSCCYTLLITAFPTQCMRKWGQWFYKHTNKHTLWYQSKDQCLLRLLLHSYKEKRKHAGTSGDQTWICLESSLTQTSPHTYTHRHKHMLTLTYTYHCSALFSLKTGSFERAGVVFFNVCVFISASVGTVYSHTHMLVRVHYSPASNLIRSTAGLWLCHIYIQMEI